MTVRQKRGQGRVFDLLVQGKTNTEIAIAIGRSEKTVKSHVTNILKRYACESRCELIAKYYRRLLASDKSVAQQSSEAI